MYTSLCSSLLAFESWLTSKGQNAFRQTMLWMRSLSFFIKTKVQPQSDLQYCLSVVGGFFLGKGCCNCNTFATGGGSISKVYLESYDFSKSSELDFSCNTKMQGFLYFREEFGYIICNCSVYNHFNKWSVTNPGIFPHIALEWHIFYLNKYDLLWIFDPKWGIWSSSTK